MISQTFYYALKFTYANFLIRMSKGGKIRFTSLGMGTPSAAAALVSVKFRITLNEF